jgi:hypothetical protein
MNEHAGQKEFNLQLWSVRVSISVKISANKVNKLEERLLAPPVYSLRRTHAYDKLPFAEPSWAEQLGTVTAATAATTASTTTTATTTTTNTTTTTTTTTTTNNNNNNTHQICVFSCIKNSL